MFYKEKVMKRDAGEAETLLPKFVMWTKAQGCKEMGDFNWVCLKIVYPYTQWLMIIIPIKWL